MNTAMRALLFCGILALLATACTPRLSVSTEVRLRDASRASLRSSIDSTNTLLPEGRAPASGSALR